MFLLVGLVAGLGVTLVWKYRGSDRQPRRGSEAPATVQPIQSSPVAGITGEVNPAPPTTNAPAMTVLGLATGRSPEAVRASLDSLRRHIAALPTDAASREIREALDAGTDALTGMEFKLAANGALAQAPTLRVFLLDQLSQIDPMAAAAYAEKILSSPGSPDEWAVSMRSYAMVRQDAESRAFLQQKFREMLAQDSWRGAPSVGFLEAFDVAVHTGGRELVPDLTTLVRNKDNRAVAHAAYLALDRLTIREPATMLAELQNQPEAMTGREVTRANFFARANMGDPQQREIVEAYLLDPRLSPLELQAFAGVFPNANYMVSPNLITKVITPERGTLAVRDRLALDTVNQWLADPRFEKVKPQLEKVRQRLDMFVRQASGGTQQQ